MKESSGLIRAFLAFPLPPAVIRYAETMQHFLQRQGVAAKWVLPQNMHVTLWFLGQQTPETLGRFADAIAPVCRQTPPLTLSYAGFNVFGKPPRVLFLNWSCRDPDMDPTRLLERVQKAGRQVGLVAQPGNPFKAHVTVGRLRTPQQTQALLTLCHIKCRELHWDVSPPPPPSPLQAVVLDRLTLYQSILTPTGPLYTPRREIQLGH